MTTSRIVVLAATPLEGTLIRTSPAELLVTGVAAVNTAHALAAYLTARPKPPLVIQTGIAGAFVQAQVAVGSVVMADREIYGDLGVLTPDGWQPMNAIGIPIVEADRSRPARFNEFPLDAALVARAASAAGPAIARIGPFLTLSQVTGVRALADVLYGRFGAVCESMEGAAAAHVCALHDVPFLEVRGVSNLIEDRDRGRWRIADAAEAAQRVVLGLIDHFGAAS